MISTDNIECIAIIGMSGRFPGARNLEEFWHNLANGVESIRQFSNEELAEIDVNPADLSAPSYVKAGAPLSDSDCFDATFFSISPREAEVIDPQHRLFLESAWEALEHSGYGNVSDKSRVGVYGGASSLNYLLTNVNHMLDVSHPNKYLKAWLGNDKDYLATRTSYYLNLSGPSINVQTACSTSLVAVSLACQGLSTYQCNLAIAGGVTVAQPQATGYFYEEGSILSPDGHCRAFDAQAQGTVFGDGVGVVVLKRLEEAIADCDTIHAVIRGSAINNDGSLKVGYTAPSVEGQADVIAMAQVIAGVDPSSITYVEAHGTGTSLGDPIEVSALTQVFQEGINFANTERSHQTQYCALGSVKTNIGHLNGAAGIAGLIKTVLALKHGQIPASLNFNEPNPHIDFENSPFYVNTKLKNWSTNGTPRRAGLSSFGIGGTNVHMILEEAPEQEKPYVHSVERPMHLLTLSAKTDSALCQLANRYISFLENHPTIDLGDLCFTANQGRARLTDGLAVVAISPKQLQQSLQDHVNTSSFSKALNNSHSHMNDLLWHGEIPPEVEDRVVFLFPGEGLLNIKDVGKQLYETQPTFAQSINRCESIIQRQQAFSLIDVLFGAPRDKASNSLTCKGKTFQTYCNQISLFALEYALAQLWISWGIKPKAVIGKGVGEYVAATIAGVLRLDDILGLMLARLSGDDEDLLHKFTNDLRYHHPRIQIMNGETGEWMNDIVTTPEYWLARLRTPEKTNSEAKGIEALESEGYKVVLAVFSLNPVEQKSSQGNITWLEGLNPNVPPWQSMLSSLATLYGHGVKIDWTGFEKDYSRRRIPLPTYPFERQRHWLSPSLHLFSGRYEDVSTFKTHPLLNHPQRSPLFQGVLFESQFNTTILPFLKDHQIYNQVVVSGALFLSMLLDAANQVQTQDSQIKAGVKDIVVLENIVFPQPLTLLDRQTRTVQLLMNSEQEGRKNCRIVSTKLNPSSNSTSVPETWLVHSQAEMLFQTAQSALAEIPISIAEVQERAARQVAPAELFQMLLEHQVTLDRSHKWISAIWQGEGEALCKLELPDELIDITPYQLHPGLIDSCFQVLGVNTLSEGTHPETYVPFSIKSFQFFQRSHQTSLWCYAQLEEANISTGKVVGNLQLLDDKGQLIAVAKRFESRRASQELLQRSIIGDRHDKVYNLTWIPQDLDYELHGSSPAGQWLILTELGGEGFELAQRLEARGDICTIIAPHSSHQNKDAIYKEVRYFDSSSPGEFRDLLQSVLTEVHSYRGIIYCTSQNPPDDCDKCDQSQFGDCARALDLLQVLVNFYSKQEVSFPPLWLVTQGAQAVGLPDEQLDARQAPLWGMGRVALIELPDLPVMLLDLEQTDEQTDKNHATKTLTEEQLTSLMSELDYGNGERQVAWRQGKRYVLRLNRRQVDRQTPNLVIHQEGSYLITGGLGALGLMMAQRLVDLGVKSLILVGRRGASPIAQMTINELEQRDVSVRVCSVDITQFEDVKSLIEMIQQELPPLRGVINAAGTLDDGIILQQSWERYWSVMQPKVVGTWNLHSLTQTQYLDFFVCFSSAAALLGSPGQSNYAAANAFMDTLMHVRRAEGLPGLSVNWGSWANEGMSAQLENLHQERSASFGLSPLPMDIGWMLLKELIGTQFGDSPVSQVAVIDLDWSRYIPRIPSHARPFLSELSPAFDKSLESNTQPSFVLDLLHIPSREQRKHLEVHVRNVVSNLLGLSLEKLDNNQSLFDLGLDSLMAVDLRRVLEKSIGKKLSSVIVFDNPTVTEMVEHLATEVLQLYCDSKVQSEPTSNEIQASKEESQIEIRLSELSQQLDELSENELANLLEEKLNNL
ncbi:MAG: type I polyketide synthase [Symploca sp. SIO2D2]|nr:type I polyketide synthase [Symploca sp. SIO2D2]